jgi:hypothetical protein
MTTQPNTSQPDLLALLPKDVKTIHDAEAFLLALAKCDKMFHFDDDPHDIACFSPEEAEVVDALRDKADDVTRAHYGLVGDRCCNAGIWDGLVKDVLPIGYLCFGADDERRSLYVYNDSKLIQVSGEAWEKLKADALDVERDCYDVDMLDAWFNRQEGVA